MAYIIDSLKRPGEVTALRQVYGDHFVLIGLQSQKLQRQARLVARLMTAGNRRDEAEQKAAVLIERDDHEEVPGSIEEPGYGQDMLGSLPDV